MAGIKDVAKLAGVSTATVSRIINNTTAVDPLKREKVLQAIQQLNFEPNELARNFKMQTSNIVALFVTYVTHPFLGKLTYHIENELYKHDLKMVLCNSEGHPEKESAYLDLVSKNKVLGIIGITFNDVEEIVQANVPFVSFDRFLGKKIPSVSSDNFNGGRLAMRELVRRGCKKVAFIGAADRYPTEISKRREGFLHEGKLLGIKPILHLKRNVHGDLSKETAFIDQLFDKHPEIDGIFANSDILAAASYERAMQRGIEVPKQLKIIGYDGIQDNDYFSPYLSTIVQPVHEIAKAAVELLLQKIENPDFVSDTKMLPVSFRQGETT